MARYYFIVFLMMAVVAECNNRLFMLKEKLDYLRTNCIGENDVKFTRDRNELYERMMRYGSKMREYLSRVREWMIRSKCLLVEKKSTCNDIVDETVVVPKSDYFLALPVNPRRHLYMKDKLKTLMKCFFPTGASFIELKDGGGEMSVKYNRDSVWKTYVSAEAERGGGAVRGREMPWYECYAMLGESHNPCWFTPHYVYFGMDSDPPSAVMMEEWREHVKKSIQKTFVKHHLPAIVNVSTWRDVKEYRIQDVDTSEGFPPISRTSLHVKKRLNLPSDVELMMNCVSENNEWGIYYVNNVRTIEYSPNVRNHTMTLVTPGEIHYEYLIVQVFAEPDCAQWTHEPNHWFVVNKHCKAQFKMSPPPPRCVPSSEWFCANTTYRWCQDSLSLVYH